MTARYRTPDNIGYVVVDGDGEEAPPSAYLAALPTGPIHWLDSTGHLIWSAAADLQSETAVVAEVAELTGEEPDRVRVDVVEFLRTLVESGLLEKVPQEAGQSGR